MFITITTELISQLTGVLPKDFHSLQSLDLHLQSSDKDPSNCPKIRKIEKLAFFPNLKQLNLSYNAITRIENLDKLANLVELNIAENAIKKIENLDGLVSLERLNLSGNQIERIPPSMSRLKRLTNLRLARNLLNVLDDVVHLSSLNKLTNLRLDDNPLTSTRDYELFTIFHVPSLTFLDGVDITSKNRDNARVLFAVDHVQLLHNKIASEMARLARLRKEIQEDVGHGDEIPQDILESQSLAIKLNEVKQCEAQLTNLKLKLHQITTKDTRGIMLPYSSSEHSEPEESKSKASQSMSWSRSPPLSPKQSLENVIHLPSPQIDLANRTIIELNQKVGKLASKVLSVEKEKNDLHYQLSQQNVSSGSVDSMKRDLFDMELDLKEAVLAAKSSHEEANALREELMSTKQRLFQKEAELDEKSGMINQYLKEIHELKEENKKNLHLLEELRKVNTHHSAIDDHRSQELRLNSISSKLDLEQAKRQIEALRSELDECRSMKTSLNGDLLDALEEIKLLREISNGKESKIKEQDDKLFSQERDLRKLQQSINACNLIKNQLEQENASLQGKLHVLEAELVAMTKKPTKDSSSKGAVLFLSPQRKQLRNQYFFDIDSTDSEDFNELDVKDFTLPLSKFEPNEMDAKAAEIIAFILLQELNFENGIKKDRMLKECCLRAAFRLIFSSSQLYMDTTSDEQVKIPLTPFHALGDKEVLAKLVADAQNGIAHLEDAALAKKELSQMKKVQQELENKLMELDRTYREKSATVKTLEQHAIEAKTQAENSLKELENIQKKLQITRDEFLKIDSDHHIVQRELDLAKYNLRECISLGNVESKNVSQLRDRIAQLKTDHDNLESNILQMKEVQMKEESKLRSVKSTISEEIRLLQLDINKLQNEFKQKRVYIDEYEKQRKLQEEEWEIRKKDIDNYFSMKSREVEDEVRKLNSCRNEYRAIKLEIDTIQNKKKQLEYELGQLQEKLHVELSRFESEDRDVRKKLQNAEKQINDQERKCKTLKEKRLLLESECLLVQQNIQELKTTFEDVEKSVAQKRKSGEEEYSQLQHQIQVASRNHRQLVAQIEQTQHEHDLVQAELRSVQRKNDDSKRSCQDLEGKLEKLQRDIQRMVQERDRIEVQTAQCKKEEESVKQNLLLLKSSLEHEEKLSEDVRRKVVTLHGEEILLQQSEQKMKSSLVGLKQQIEEHRDELQQTRLAIDRERRDLQDLVTKRTLLDGEITQLQDQLHLLQEKRQSEKSRFQEFEHQILKSVDEMNRIAKQVISYEKKLEDLKHREEELLTAEKTAQCNYSKLIMEYDGTKERYSQEKHIFTKMQEDSDRLKSLIEGKQRELQELSDRQQAMKQDVDGMKLQINQLENVKIQLEKEIIRYQEFNQLEMTRLEKLQTSCLEAEKQLKALREESEMISSNYEKTKLLSVEEARKVELQRQTWKATNDELARLDSSIQDVRQQLEIQRRQTIEEMGKLEQAKRSACSHLIHINEGRHRLQQTTTTAAESIVVTDHPVTSVPAKSPQRNKLSQKSSSKSGKLSQYSLKCDLSHSDDDSSASSAAPFQLSQLNKAVENLRAKSSGALVGGKVI